MVITVTLNPAVDRTLNIDDFKAGIVNRASEVRYDIGGKGINVSKVLKNFGVDSICTGFLGGVWENLFISEIKKRQIDVSFTHIEGTTRTNTKIADQSNKVFTDVNEPGPFIKRNELDSFLNNFKSICGPEDIVVLSGGASASIPKDIYAELIKAAKEKGALTVLDADGELLREGIKEEPYMIKPNVDELKKLMNLESDKEEDIIKAAKKLIDTGINKILISLGEKGAILVTNNGVYSCDALKVQVKSTVGAGDSMVAALVYSEINKLSEIETLGFANACGAASVSLEGTEACTIAQVKELYKQITVRMKEEF